MARTIAVSNEVYEMLKKIKLPDESFSDVIMKLIKRRGSLLDIVGSKIITEKGWKMLMKYRMKSNIADIREKKENMEMLGE